MKQEWRITEDQSHALFVALRENEEELRAYPESVFQENIPLWKETLRGAVRLVIAPIESDRGFFALVVERELIRLAGADAERLSCGCETLRHRRALQSFRTKYLVP